MTLTAPLANAHAASAAVAGTSFFNTIALLIDTKGPVATWAHPGDDAAGDVGDGGRSGCRSGDTQVRLASLTGRAAGDTLQIDQGPNAETVKIASVVDPAPAAPAPNVVLTSALAEDATSSAPRSTCRRSSTARSSSRRRSPRCGPTRACVTRPTPSPTAPAARRPGG